MRMATFQLNINNLYLSLSRLQLLTCLTLWSCPNVRYTDTCHVIVYGDTRTTIQTNWIANSWKQSKMNRLNHEFITGLSENWGHASISSFIDTEHESFFFRVNFTL